MQQKNMLTQSDLDQIRLIMRSELKNYPTRLEMNKRFDTMTQVMTKKTNLIISFFDTEHKELESRVQKVEQFLKLT